MDLTGANLTNANLNGVDLEGANLTGADLTHVSGSITGTPTMLPAGYSIITGSTDSYIFGPDVNLAYADLKNTDLSNVDITGINLYSAELSGATLTGVSGTIMGMPASMPTGYSVIMGANGAMDSYIFGPGINLAGADLTGFNLDGVDLTSINLEGADLSGAALSGVTGTITGTPSSMPQGYGVISGPNDSYIIGPGVDLSNADLTGADLTGINLSGVTLTGATLIGVSGSITGTPTLPTGYSIIDGFTYGTGGNFNTPTISDTYIVGPGVDLTGANLTNANLNGVDLEGANLTGADLTHVSGSITGTPTMLPAGYSIITGSTDSYIFGPDVNLAYADLKNTDLSNVDITGINLYGAELSGATLTGVSGTIMGMPASMPTGYSVIMGANGAMDSYIFGPGINLAGADLTGFNLDGVDLTSINLEGADLSGAALSGVTGTITGTPSSMPQGYGVISGPNDSYIIGPGVDLSNADLTGADLTGINLSGVTLTGATLIGVSGSITGTPTLPTGYSIIAGSSDSYIVGPGVDLTGADLIGADLNGVDLEGANLTGADLTHVSGSITGTPTMLPAGYSIITGSTYSYIFGPDVNLAYADLKNTDLSNVDITGINLYGAQLAGATLTGVSGTIMGTPASMPTGYIVINGPNDSYIFGPGINLAGADLDGFNLSGADLTGINLEGAALDGANLNYVTGTITGTPSSMPQGYGVISGPNDSYIIGPNVNLSNADLTGADLTGINLSGVTLTGATLIGVSGSITGTPTLPTGYSIIDGSSDSYIVGPGVDLSNADLTGADLTGIDLTNANLTAVTSGSVTGAPTMPTGYGIINNYIVGPNVYLSNADLTGADLNGVNLTGANLQNADLTGADLTNAILTGANLFGADLIGANLTNASITGNPGIFSRADLSGANLTGLDLSGLDLYQASLSGAIGLGVDAIKGSDIRKGDLSDLDLSGFNLQGTHLSETNLSGVSSGGLIGTPSLPSGYSIINGYILGPNVDLTNADLTFFDLTGIDLTGVTLTGATLTSVSGSITGTPTSMPTGYSIITGSSDSYIVGPGVDLTGADLIGADLTGIDLTNANLTDVTSGSVTGAPTMPTGYVIINNYIVGPNVDLTGADLSAADLGGVDLTGADLTGADLADVTSGSVTGAPTLPTDYSLVNGYIVGPNLDLTGADLTGGDLAGVDLTGTDLTGVLGSVAGVPTLPAEYSIINNYIVGPNVDLTGADLTDADLNGINLTGVTLTGATLTDVSGSITGTPASITLPTGYSIITGSSDSYIVGPGVDLTGADLIGADLTGIDLTNANLTDVTSGSVTGAPTMPTGYVIINNYIVGPNVDLTGADLSAADLGGVDLTGADLTGADLADVTSGSVTGAPTLPTDYSLVNGYIVGPNLDLTGADLTGGDLAGVDLTGTDLTGVLGSVAGVPTLPAEYSIINNYIVGPNVDLTGADLTDADLNGINLTGVTLTGAVLTGVASGSVTGAPTLPTDYSLVNGYIVGPNLDLTGADLAGGDLAGINLTGTDLTGVSGSVAGVPTLPAEYSIINNYIVGPNVDLTGADLSSTNLREFNLTNANLTDSVLTGADLTNSNLTDAILTNANLDGTVISGATYNNNLSQEQIEKSFSQEYWNAYADGPIGGDEAIQYVSDILDAKNGHEIVDAASYANVDSGTGNRDYIDTLGLGIEFADFGIAVINTGEGSDIIGGGKGDYKFDGGAGFDLFIPSYTKLENVYDIDENVISQNGVYVELETGKVTYLGLDGKSDDVENIEWFLGTTGDDLFIGSQGYQSQYTIQAFNPSGGRDEIFGAEDRLSEDLLTLETVHTVVDYSNMQGGQGVVFILSKNEDDENVDVRYTADGENISDDAGVYWNNWLPSAEEIVGKDGFISSISESDPDKNGATVILDSFGDVDLAYNIDQYIGSDEADVFLDLMKMTYLTPEWAQVTLCQVGSEKMS